MRIEVFHGEALAVFSTTSLPAMPPVAQGETPAQRRKRIRKLNANKLRKKERAANTRYLNARFDIFCKTRDVKGHYAAPYEGIWRVGNWDFNLNNKLPA